MTGKLNRISAVVSAVALCFAFAGCGSSNKDSKNETTAKDTLQSAEANTDDTGNQADDNNDKESTGKYINYTQPVKGEDIVVISVKGKDVKGDIKIKLFPDEMPEACENFETHAKDGYYDELIFHRVIDDFMIQGGDPQGTGQGGELIDKFANKSGFDMGTSDKLLHLVGAVAYANSGSTSTNGSQFYIVTGSQGSELTDDYFKNMESGYGKKFDSDAQKLYKENGGSPYLDGDYTVFGQVIDGLDVAYKIAQTTEKDAQDKPYSDIVMDSVKVEKYDGFKTKMHVSDYDDIDLSGYGSTNSNSN